MASQSGVPCETSWTAHVGKRRAVAGAGMIGEQVASKQIEQATCRGYDSCCTVLLITLQICYVWIFDDLFWMGWAYFWERGFSKIRPMGVVHCSVQNAAVLCVNQHERFTQHWASSSEERRKKNTWPVLRVFGLVPLLRFLVPLGVLLVMKTLEDEWYVVIRAYKLAVFEILRDFLYCNILHVRAIPTLL